jgi:hypothetical protein
VAEYRVDMVVRHPLCTCPCVRDGTGFLVVQRRDDCPGAVTHPRVLTAAEMEQLLPRLVAEMERDRG